MSGMIIKCLGISPDEKKTCPGNLMVLTWQRVENTQTNHPFGARSKLGKQKPTGTTAFLISFSISLTVLNHPFTIVEYRSLTMINQHSLSIHHHYQSWSLIIDYRGPFSIIVSSTTNSPPPTIITTIINHDKYPTLTTINHPQSLINFTPAPPRRLHRCCGCPWRGASPAPARRPQPAERRRLRSRHRPPKQGTRQGSHDWSTDSNSPQWPIVDGFSRVTQKMVVGL